MTFATRLAVIWLLMPHVALTNTKIGIPLEQFQNLMNSELDHLLPWEGQQSYGVEHDRALTLAGNSTYPFLVCNSAHGQSGHDRRAALQELVQDDVLVVSNKLETSCFLAPLDPWQISMLEFGDAEYTIQPLSGSMRIKKGTMDVIGNYGLNEEKILGVVLCSGEPSKTAAQGPLDELASTSNVGVQIIADIRSHVQNRFLRESSNSITLLDRKLTHDRALMWRDAMEDGIYDIHHRCDSMFQELDISFASSIVLNFGFGTGTAGDESSSSNPACLVSLVAALSSHPKVCAVEAIKQDRLHNTNAQWIAQSGQKDERPFWDVGITGSGQIVQVSDTGLDTNHCFFWDRSPGELRDGTVQTNRRKVVMYDDYKDNTDISNGHGTHVVGTILGKRSENGTIAGEAGGPDEGVAKDAKVAFFDVGLGNRCCFIPSPSQLFDSGRDAGAKIASASWGNRDNSYNSGVQAFDEYLYKHQDFLFLTSAGNSGQGDRKNTVGSRGVGKNLIAVGASMNFGDGPGPDYLAYFSSRGPSEDGRIKPDLVAPGRYVSSARSNGNAIGECGNNMRLQGTSMSCPVAAGSAAMVRQYFEDGYYPTGKSVKDNGFSPSASLVKAVLINGAQSLVAVEDTKTPVEYYDEHQGFGRVNLISSLKLDGKNDLDVEVHDRAIDENETPHSLLFTTRKCPSQEMRATLVWTDEPGMTGCNNGNCLINDLDLMVIKEDGTLYRPNGLDDQADHVNNVERVRITDVEKGEGIWVEVHASNLMAARQSYALVVSGCFEGPSIPGRRSTPSPTPPPTPSGCNDIGNEKDCKKKKDMCKWDKKKKTCAQLVNSSAPDCSKLGTEKQCKDKAVKKHCKWDKKKNVCVEK